MTKKNETKDLQRSHTGKRTRGQRWTERRAYQAEIQCLQNKLENECVGECEEIIRLQMADAREHLLGYR